MDKATAWEFMVINIKELNKFAVIGMGASGISSLRLLHFLGQGLDKEVYAINQGDPAVWAKGNPIFEQLDDKYKVAQAQARSVIEDCELIILSPGIARDIELLKGIETPIWSEIELGYQFLSSEEVMAITGTNGKTTTVSFLQECLEHQDIAHFVGGNIGTPLTDYVYDKLNQSRPKAKVILLELSSFQLESMFTFRANAAAILNITFSHGERYEELSEYAQAKAHIFDHQKKSDHAFYPAGLWQELGLEEPSGPQQFCELSNDIEVITKYLENIISLSDLKIYGQHNLRNLYFAHHLWKCFFDCDEAFVKAAQSFRGVKYRFQLIREANGLRIFNDAKSTNWQATETALRAVDKDVFLILGGQLRGEGDDGIKYLAPYRERIKKIFLIGEAGNFLEPLLKDQYEFKNIETLENLRSELANHPIQGNLVFSPAFPSFDQFRNYVHRGEVFSELFSN